MDTHKSVGEHSVHPHRYVCYISGRGNPSPTNANCFDSKMATHKLRRGALRAPAPICLLYQREDDILPYNKLALIRFDSKMATHKLRRGALRAPAPICLLYQREGGILPYNKLALIRFDSKIATNNLRRGALRAPVPICLLY